LSACSVPERVGNRRQFISHWFRRYQTWKTNWRIPRPWV
jgi:hypothetical protein